MFYVTVIRPVIQQFGTLATGRNANRLCREATSNTLKTVILGPFCPKDRAAAQVPRAECRNKTALPGIIIIKQHIRLYVPAALPVPGQVSVPS